MSAARSATWNVPINTELAILFDSLQEMIGKGNAERGFHDEGDRLRAENAEAEARQLGSFVHAGANLRNYYMTKLALVHSEATEAVEELRNGRAVDETYYSVDGVEVGDRSLIAEGRPAKPEGLPSEIADIVIRCFDFADEGSFSLGDIILEKLAFNATRGKMHGGKAV